MKFAFAALYRVLRPAAWLVFAWVLFFEVWRVVLVVASWSLHGDATPTLLLKSFLYGARFDLAVTARVLMLFVLWAIWRPTPGRLERRLVLGLYGLAAFVCACTLMAEVEFYKEFQMRLGPLAFQFFGKPEHNEIVLGMIWHGYPVVRWMLVCVTLWASLVWWTRRFLVHAGSAGSMAAVSNRSGAANGPDTGWLTKLVAACLWLFVSVAAGRGGLQHAPLRWGDAMFSQNTYANHMAQNGVFAVMGTLQHMGRSRRADVSGWLRAMRREEAFAAAREMTLLPGETLVEPGVYPLLRHSLPSSLPLKKRPTNVVVVVMESFTARFCGATGAGFGATPRYDELAREGILFDRAFSIGTHTAQGIFATLCSFPALPEYETIMKHSMGSQPFLSLPAILSARGYETLFLYNGLFSWDNKEGFFRNHGMRRFIGRHDYKNPTFVDPDWGVCDQDVFDRALEEFSGLAAGSKPFLGVVLTLSNHAPFNLPKVGLEPFTGGGLQNNRLNGVHYADWAVGRFMAAARNAPWFNDTLFVFTGDHGYGIPPVLTDVNVLHMHVPILFYGPGIFGDRHEVRHTTIGQMDIMPTILGLLGRDIAHQSFGRDVFSLPPGDLGRAYVKQSGDPNIGLIEGNEMVIATLGRPTRLHTLDLSFPPGASADLSAQKSDRTREMERRLRALVVTGLSAIEQRLAAPSGTRKEPTKH